MPRYGTHQAISVTKLRKTNSHSCYKLQWTMAFTVDSLWEPLSQLLLILVSLYGQKCWGHPCRVKNSSYEGQSWSRRSQNLWKASKNYTQAYMGIWGINYNIKLMIFLKLWQDDPKNDINFKILSNSPCLNCCLSLSNHEIRTMMKNLLGRHQ